MTVDLSATGGLDAAGNWHDTDGRFAPKGKSTAKHLVQKAVDVLRGALAAATAKAAGDDGVDLDVDPDHKLAAKLGHRPRVRWGDERHALVDVPDGKGGTRRMRVGWDAFIDPVPAGHDRVPDTPNVPVDRNDMPDRPRVPIERNTIIAHEKPPVAAVDAITKKDSTWAARQMFNHDLGDGYQSVVTESSAFGFGGRQGIQAFGHILDPEGNIVGHFDRAVYHQRIDTPRPGQGLFREDGPRPEKGPPIYGPVIAAHESLDINEAHRGNGLGTRFIEASETAYRAAGVNRIEVYASSVTDHDGNPRNGAYTWARAGFDWASFGEGARIGRMLEDEYPNSPLVERFLNATTTDDLPTPREVADDPDGRKLLLDETAWNGVKHLTPRADTNDLVTAPGEAADGFDTAAYRAATADRFPDAAWQALDRLIGFDDSAPLDYYARVMEEANRIVNGGGMVRVNSEAYKGEAERLRAAVDIAPPAGVPLWRTDGREFQPGDTVTFPLVSVTPDRDYAKVYADPNVGQGTKRSLLEFPADTKYFGATSRYGDHEGVTSGAFRVVSVDPGEMDVNGDEGLPHVRLEPVPVGDTNDLTGADLGGHQPSYGPGAHEIARRPDFMPTDALEHPTYYTGADKATLAETMQQLRAADGNPDAQVTIYRAVPPEVAAKGTGEVFDQGNWVTLSRAYAEQHAMQSDDAADDWPVESITVPASTVRFAGDDLMEWGYFPDGDPDPENNDWPGDANDLLMAPARPQAPAPAPVDLPPPVVPDGLEDAEREAQAAVDALFDIHHTDVGINGVDLPTLPTVPNGERFRHTPMDPATQRLAIEQLFRPNVDPRHMYFQPLTIVDDTPATANQPIRAVAVNLATGEIVGSHAPWQPGPAGKPPYGRWASLPADHPQAAQLVTAAWLASPGAKRYLTEQLYPRLRDGGYRIDPVFPGLTETVRRQADEIAAPYRGIPDIAVRRVTDLDGTHYVPDPDGRLTIHGDDIHFADFAENGGLRLWVRPDLAHEEDVTGDLEDLDYTDADNPDLPWDQRVAALAQVREKLTAIFGPTPSDLFTKPTEADLEGLYRGEGGDREIAYVQALGRFGESLEALVDARRAADARQPDKRKVLDKLAEMPGVPPPLADLLSREDWDYTIVGTIDPSPSAPNGGGHIDIRFANHPESAVVVYTSAVTNETHVAWEFAAEHQVAVGVDEFTGWSPYGRLTLPTEQAPADWFASLAEPGGPIRLRTGENTPEMSAWLATMEALGVDMGTDDTLWFAAGRDRLGEDTGMPERGAVPTLVSDLDGTLARTVDAGLRPFPRSWTETLGGKLNRVAIDARRDFHEGTSSHFPDVSVIDVPSIDRSGDYVDVPTHEFTHVFERTVDGLMLVETWHFIQRLRREQEATGRRSTWTWNDGERRAGFDDDGVWRNGKQYGYRDEWGDEYMGRVYRSGYTGIEGVTAAAGHEIFSTMAQTLWDHRHGSRRDLDPEARRLFLSILAVFDPARPARRWQP